MKKALFAVFLSVFCASCALLTIRGADEDSDFTKGVNAFNAANFPLAEKYLEPDARNGNADAQYLIGLMTLNASGEINVCKAEENLEKAAEQGHVPAQMLLAKMYKDPRYPLYNPAQAYFWFAAASQDSSGYQAQINNLNWTLTPEQKKRLRKIKPRAHSLNYNHLYPMR